MTNDTSTRALRNLPEWSWPGLIPLVADSKLPIEKRYTTLCASRYEDEGWDPEARMEELAVHLTDGGNVGWVPPEGICVLDCDNIEGVVFVDARRDKLTPVMKRRKQKQHFYFSYNPDKFNAYTRAGIALELGGAEPARIDIKSCGFSSAKKGGGYVVMPPSHHEDGVDYKWARKLPKDQSKIPEIPIDVANALAPFLTKGAKKSGSDNRHLKVLKYQQRLVIEADVDDDDTRDEIIAKTREVAEELYGDEADRLSETLGGLDRAYDGARAHDSAFQGYAEDGSDEYLAVVIDHHHDRGLIHVLEEKSWRVWEDGYWQPAHMHEIRRVIGEYHRELLTDAALERDDARQERLKKYSYALKGVRAVDRVYRRMLDNLGESIQSFDQRNEFVTFPAGLGVDAITLNITTGETLEPDPEHRITRVMGAPYVPGASHPMVERFFEESFPDPETRRCVIMHLGMALLGRLPVERFYFMHGKGASGKGTLAAGMVAAMGDYATQADPSTISGNGGLDGSRNAPDLYALRAKRFVFVDEIAATRTLGSRLKNLTQDGEITAAGKYMAQTAFPITWTTWIAGNARPKIDSTDKGLMRRITEVPMDSGAVDNDHIDWHVKDTLKRDPEAIAAFMWKIVEGLTEARTYDFRPPISPQMEAATKEWVELSDMIGPWLADAVEITHSEDDRVMSAELHSAYTDWMDDKHGYRSDRDYPRATPNQFAAGLKARGVVKKAMTRGTFWFGLKLRSGEDGSEKGGPSLKIVPKLPDQKGK